MSQHGDFNSFGNCLCYQNCVYFCSTEGIHSSLLTSRSQARKSRDFCLSEKQLCLKFDFNHKIELFPSLLSQVQAWISYSLWDMNNWTYYFNFAYGCGGPLMLTERYWKLTKWHLYANKWSSSYISVDWTTAPDFFVIKRLTKLDRSYISADPMAELHHAVSKVIKKTFFNSLLFFRLSNK